MCRKWERVEREQVSAYDLRMVAPSDLVAIRPHYNLCHDQAVIDGKGDKPWKVLNW